MFIHSSARISFVSVDRGYLEADAHGFVLTQESGSIRIPVHLSGTIMIEPDVVVTHAAIKLAAESKTPIDLVRRSRCSRVCGCALPRIPRKRLKASTHSTG